MISIASKRILLVITLILVFNSIFSQKGRETDSVINLIASEPDAEAKINVYIKYSRKILDNFESSLVFENFDNQFIAQNKKKENDEFDVISKVFNVKNLFVHGEYVESEKLALSFIEEIKEKDPINYADVLQILSQIKNIEGDFEQAKEYALMILDVPKTEKTQYALFDANIVLGMINYNQGYYKTALKFYFKADSLQIDNERAIAFLYEQISALYSNFEDYKNAKKYLKKAIEINKKANAGKMDLAFTNINLISIESNLGNYEIADSIIKTSLKVYKEHGDTNVIFITERLWAVNLLRSKQFNPALDKFKYLINNRYKYFKLIDKVQIYQHLADCHIARNEFKLAEFHLDSSLYYAEIKNLESVTLSVLKTKERFYSKQNKYKEAFEVSKEIDSVKSVFEEKENLKQINELTSIYESEKKEKENLILKAEKVEIQQAKQNQFYQFLIGIIFLGLGLIVVYLLFKNRQRRNEKLKELDTLKSKFFESISHELRTPLTLIQLPVSKAIKEKERISDSNLKTIKYNTERLQHLMDDLLSITRLEAKKYPVKNQDLDIYDQVRVLASQFDSLADSKGIEYIKTIPAHSLISSYDQEILNKIIINLISNAIKYSFENGKVELEVEVENGVAKLTVKDKGRGIRKENQQYVFDRFYRVDQNNENVPGSGIGLSIVKELLELIGGSISFTSVENEGSQFIAVFPVVETQSAEKIQKNEIPSTIKMEVPQEENDIENSDKPFILIAEDNIDLLRYMKEELKEEYKVFTAEDGKQGIDKGIELVPDLIITDWLMPNKNGIELCEAIKSNEITNHIPVIMLTAKAEVEDKIQGFQTGADAYFSKPFEMEVVKAQIKNLILQRKKMIEKFSDGDSSSMNKNISERDLKFWNAFKDLVDQNISNPDFSVQILADKMFISRMQLNRKVKALTDSSGSVYILNQRMKLAVKLLENKDLQITEIAYKVGYDNVNSFSRVFKKEYNETPSGYRANRNK